LTQRYGSASARKEVGGGWGRLAENKGGWRRINGFSGTDYTDFTEKRIKRNKANP